MRKYRVIINLIIFASLFVPFAADAGSLTSVQDVISDSRPSALPEHSMTFYTSNSVPISGKIVVTPSSGNFNIESGLNFNDIDLLVNNVQVPLASSPGSGSGSPIGVNAVTGTSGSLTFTLNDSDPINSGDLIEIRVGSSTSFGGVGNKTIQLPSSTGGYNIDFETEDSGSVTIDSKTTMIFVTPGIDVIGSNSTSTPPAPPPPPPTPSPAPVGSSVTIPQGGGAAVAFPSLRIGIPSVPFGTGGGLTTFLKNNIGAVFITDATNTVIVSSVVVNSFANVSIPLIQTKTNVIIFPIDSRNKLIVEIPVLFGPPDGDILLVIRKTPKAEVASIPLPPNRNIIDGGIYKVNLYVNGVSVEKLFKPIILGIFYGEDGFLREPVELYHSKDFNPGWSIVADVTKDLDGGFVTIKNLQDLSLFATMGIKAITKNGSAPNNFPPPPPVIRSTTHPDQYLTYDNSSPEFEWSLSHSTGDVSFVIDQDPTTIPDDTSEGQISAKKYENLHDGTWYFHIKSRNDFGWGGTAHFVIQIRTKITPEKIKSGVSGGIVKISKISPNTSPSEKRISIIILIISLWLLLGCIRCNRSCNCESEK